MQRVLIKISGMFIMLVMLIVGLGGCFNDPENNELDSPDDIEIVDDAEGAESTEAYKYAIVSNEEGNYIIGKTANGGWQEILESENARSLVGFYENKLYFNVSVDLAFIDFDGTDFSSISWIDNPEPSRDDVCFSRGILIGDTMYFGYDTFAGGISKTDGILTLKLSDTSLGDAIQLIPQADFKWQIDKTNNTIYYLKAPYSNGYQLCKYDLTKGSETVLFNNVEDHKLYSDGKMLYSTTNAELYLYDTKTGDNQLIFNNLDSYSGGLWSCADYRNGDVYYKDYDQIIKYNNGNRDVVYTYSSSHGGEYFYGFWFLKDNVIELLLQMAPDIYLIDGEIIEKLPDNEKVSVAMSDGTTALFDRLESPI